MNNTNGQTSRALPTPDVENFCGVEGHFEQEWYEERYRPLLGQPEVVLFTQGGCHVFAEALHKRFGYPIHVVYGDEKDSVSHAFCLVEREIKHAVDVLGFTNINQRVWEDLGRQNYSPPVSLAELRRFYRSDRGPGLFAHRLFWEPAYTKALERIDAFLPYYDGTKPVQTTDAHLAKQTTRE